MTHDTHIIEYSSRLKDFHQYPVPVGRKSFDNPDTGKESFRQGIRPTHPACFSCCSGGGN